jgi:hypothetical protein
VCCHSVNFDLELDSDLAVVEGRGRVTSVALLQSLHKRRLVPIDISDDIKLQQLKINQQELVLINVGVSTRLFVPDSIVKVHVEGWLDDACYLLPFLHALYDSLDRRKQFSGVRL